MNRWGRTRVLGPTITEGCFAGANVRAGQKARYALRAVFRFAFESGHVATAAAFPFRATSGLVQCSKWHRYSITSSARARKDSRMVGPSALAVFRLTTRSNLVGCSTGRPFG